VIAERLRLGDSQIDSLLGRTSPVVKLGVAIVWLIGLAVTLHPLPPVILAAVALAAGLTIGGIPPLILGRTLAPVWLAALAIGLSNMLFSTANGDPTTTTLLQVGPIRIAQEAYVAGVSIMLRVAAIACVGAVFALTTDSTRLADAGRVRRHTAPVRGPRHAPAGAADPRVAWRLAPVAVRGLARARDPSRGPHGRVDGRSRLRLRGPEPLP
jgi:energy-coupling factor transporter transmembrane protein EcfT